MNIANPHTQKYYFSHQAEIAQNAEKYRLNNPEVFKVTVKNTVTRIRVK